MSDYEIKESESEFEKRLIHVLKEIAHWLKELVGKHQAEGFVLKILAEGKIMGSPATIGATGGQLSAQNADGTPYKPVGALAFASDNSAIASVDPVSGAVTAVAAGTCNLAAQDSGNKAQDQLVCTVVLTAAGFVLVLTPNPPAPAARK